MVVVGITRQEVTLDNPTRTNKGHYYYATKRQGALRLDFPHWARLTRGLPSGLGGVFLGSSLSSSTPLLPTRPGC